MAAVVVALAVLPLRDLLSRYNTKLLYGSRDEPATVLAAVSRSWTGTLDPHDLLRQVTSNVAAMMRLPYVAIEITTEEQKLTAESGQLAAQGSDNFVLTHQGRQLGTLRTGPRAGEGAMSARDHALLNRIAGSSSNSEESAV